MAFTSLIQIERVDDGKPKASLKRRGCDFCPLDKKKGIHKIMGKVRGRKIFVWGQSPGPKENRERQEFIGPSGEFLWHELKKAGITRDMCDIQNVVRCMPAEINKITYPALQMRPPSNIEIKCCSLYNDQAKDKSKAKLHLVFGAVAAKSLLGKEYSKDKRVFFSDFLKAWVIYLDHPSWFIRQGYGAGTDKTPTAQLKRFRSDLQHAKKLLKHKNYDQYQYLRDQRYIGVTNRKKSKEAYRKIVRAAKRGIRIVADMEEGKVDKKGRADDKGKSVVLCCGFAYKPGLTYIFALDAPDSRASKECRQLNRELVIKLLRNEEIKKAFHFGISDVTSAKRLFGITVRGFDYDTLLGEYFADPDAKSYGLTKIADRRYPDFQDYKSLEGPDAFTEEFTESLKQKKYDKHSMMQKVDLGRQGNRINLARLPWEKMLLYNGADCHLEKLVEEYTKKYVSMPLMRVYIDASYILHRMERENECKPLFDYLWRKKLSRLFKSKERKLEKQIRTIAGKYAYVPHKKTGEIRKIEFKPGSRDHIMWLLYDKLGYKFRGEENEKPNTKASTLLMLGLKHKKANLIVQYRQVVKAKGTYINGFYKCANLNDGYLRTNWKMTGTSTGRMSSGKTKDKKNDAVINFQNIHGDPLIKCLLVSDTRWRDIFDYWIEHGDFTAKTWKKFGDYYVDLGFDFSQNELRQLAEEANDKNLIKMFASGKDPHVEVGHEITGWPKEQIKNNDRVRKLIKNMQFGLVFGLAGLGLFKFIKARGVKTTLEEVERFHKRYFKRFKGVKILQEYYRTFAKKHKYVINVFGFRRKLKVDEQIEAGENWTGAWWGNQAINTPIQGAAHQLLMMAIAALKRYPKKFKYLLNPNKEIHDALYFRVKLKYMFKAITQGHKLMVEEPVKIVEQDFGLEKKIPLSAKPKAGFRFGVEIEFEEEGITNEWEYLNQWCRANKKLNKVFTSEQLELVQHETV